MAQSAGTITTPLPMLTIKIVLPRAYGLRMWLTARLMALTGLVCPHDMQVVVGADTPDATALIDEARNFDVAMTDSADCYQLLADLANALEAAPAR